MDSATFEIERLPVVGGYPLWLDGHRLLLGTVDHVDLFDEDAGSSRRLLDLAPSRLPVAPPLALGRDRLYVTLDQSGADIWLIDVAPVGG